MKKLITSFLMLISINAYAGLINLNKVTNNTATNLQDELLLQFEQGAADNIANLQLVSSLGADMQVSRIFFGGNTSGIQSSPFIDIELLTPSPSQDTELLLKSAGASKLNIVKLVKELTGLGLKEAKALVDNAPSVIILPANADMKAANQRLKDAGADTVLSYEPIITLDLPPVSTSQATELLLKSPGASKLNIVKLVKELTGLELKEAKDLVDNAPSVITLPVNADLEAANQRLKDAGADTALSYQTTVTPIPIDPNSIMGDEIVLNSPGSSKVNVIKALRAITGLGLKEAKDIVDRAPSIITIPSNQDIAVAAQLLKSAGADIDINKRKSLTGWLPNIAVDFNYAQAINFPIDLKIGLNNDFNSLLNAGDLRIAFEVTNSQGSEFYFGSYRTEVPEPSTLGFVFITLLFTLRRKLTHS